MIERGLEGRVVRVKRFVQKKRDRRVFFILLTFITLLAGRDEIYSSYPSPLSSQFRHFLAIKAIKDALTMNL